MKKERFPKNQSLWHTLTKCKAPRVCVKVYNHPFMSPFPVNMICQSVRMLMLLFYFSLSTKNSLAPIKKTTCLFTLERTVAKWSLSKSQDSYQAQESQPGNGSSTEQLVSFSQHQKIFLILQMALAEVSMHVLCLNVARPFSWTY